MTSRSTCGSSSGSTPIARRTGVALVALVTAAAVVLAACGDPADPVGGPAGSVAPTPPTPPTPPTETVPSTVPPTESVPETPPPTEPPPPTTGPLRYDPVRLRAELEEARARWEASAITSYRFTQTPVCFCPRDVVTAEVFAGRVTDRGGPIEARSVEEWFADIAAEIGTAASVAVTYDAELGYPTSVYVDVSELMADEEYGVERTELVPIEDPVAQLLTDPYGCGYGFWAASPDQSVAITIGIPIGDDVDGEPEPGVYDFTVLAGEIRFGTDLMANWCDDVIEEDEPTPDVTATWHIVGGDVEYTIEDGAGAPTATATLTDVVAVDGDGVEHRLGDATITNAAWGVFAG